MEKVNQEFNEITEKKGFVAWVKEHKNQLIAAGIGIPTLVAIIVGVKNKDSLKELWDAIKAEIENVNLYSSKWFAKATDSELDVEREKVRLAFCSSGDNFSEASELQHLLWGFDEEMSNRAWGDEVPHAPRIHREHGWYLPNDD